ncbi:MAG TPA: hypothetical protein VHE30_03270 [Polyangiaceae bacterium]|nr:hypothetical protein [Polyangiaceae bacterium]
MTLVGRVAVVAGGLGLVLGCEDGHVPSRGAKDAGPDARVHLPSYAPDLDAITCEPTIDSLRRDVFSVGCAFDSCHGDNNAAWGLYLGLPDVKSELVGESARTCPGWTRVVPGDPEHSFLVRKISDDHPPCGERMPFGLGELPPRVVACVTDWIRGIPEPAEGGGPDGARREGGAPDAAEVP